MYDVETLLQVKEKAHLAGMKAVDDLKVIPMLVGQETYLFSGVLDTSKPTEYVADGVCGFAWVEIYPQHKGNTKLGKEERSLLKQAGFKLDWEGKKFSYWISMFDQSMQKKEAYASAYARVLRENGLKAYSSSRMD